jgi:hypothetical protein
VNEEIKRVSLYGLAQDKRKVELLPGSKKVIATLLRDGDKGPYPLEYELEAFLKGLVRSISEIGLVKFAYRTEVQGMATNLIPLSVEDRKIELVFDDKPVRVCLFRLNTYHFPQSFGLSEFMNDLVSSISEYDIQRFAIYMFSMEAVAGG